MIGISCPTMSPSDTSLTITRIFMWIGWAFLLGACVMFSVFLTSANGQVNSFARPFDTFSAGMLIGPFALWMALRFALIPRLRNPWVQLILYAIGAFFSSQIMVYGIFLVPEYQIVFFALCGIAMLCYIPHWVRPKGTGKSGPGNAPPPFHRDGDAGGAP